MICGINEKARGKCFTEPKVRMITFTDYVIKDVNIVHRGVR